MKLFIRKILRKFGYDFVKYKKSFVPGITDKANLLLEYNWLMQFGFKTIIDIGANEGQFADKMRKIFPEAFIYSFEPLREAFNRLQKNFINDSKFKAINIALGESVGEIDFYQNEYSASSSALLQSKELIENFSYASEAQSVTVKVNKLDSVIKVEKIIFPLLIKIDVQGFEDRVINGGVETLTKADLIICEVSFVELYKGQLLFNGIFELFKKIGFTYAGCIEQLRSSTSNQVLQADAIFTKSYTS